MAIVSFRGLFHPLRVETSWQMRAEKKKEFVINKRLLVESNELYFRLNLRLNDLIRTEELSPLANLSCQKTDPKKMSYTTSVP